MGFLFMVRVTSEKVKMMSNMREKEYFLRPIRMYLIWKDRMY